MRTFAIILFIGIFTITTNSPERLEAVESDDTFKTRIRPLLEKYCIDCHAPANGKEFRFLDAVTTKDVSSHRDEFARVFEQIDKGWMPPTNADKLLDLERKLITDWVKKTLKLQPRYFDRISRYVVSTFEDKKGNLWFGTMNKGVVRFDGQQLTWFSKQDGLPSNAVPSFAEDKDGNLWVGTQQGVCRFDGRKFIKISENEGLPSGYGGVRCDRNGNLWVGINTKVFRYNGSSFSEFPVPVEKEKIHTYAITPGEVAMALHDSNGNLWFKTDGYGAIKYDGHSFTRFTSNNGLCSNNVTSIMEDRNGNIWFTCIQSYQPKMTGDGGVCCYDGKSFKQFSNIRGLSNNDIYTIFESTAGNIWIGATGVGAYRFDGKHFTLFDKTDREIWTRNFGLQDVMQDSKGTIWFGFSGGLFRFNGESFFNVNQDGPWTAEPPNPQPATEQKGHTAIGR